MPQVPPSPRRSSRAARPGQPNTSDPNSSKSSLIASNISSNSSTSSLSGRERSTRSVKQSSPPTKASTPTSEDSIALMATRRSRRQLESSLPSDIAKGFSRARDNDDDVIAEDEETTRCVCELLEYPGPPMIDAASTSLSSTRSAQKVTAPGTNDDNDGNEDEPGSLFIQCDSCEVWQHGGCVGIMSDAATPDNYFCELCRPDFHHLGTTATGQKYSRYVPIDSKRSHRKMSGVKGEDTRSAARDSVKSGSAEAPKRRSTMNSRATLDEDEQLRKALEISKQEGGAGASDTTSIMRKSKRGRDESEDAKSDVKRQRTNSSEPSHAESTIESPAEAEDDTRRKAPRTNGQAPKDKDARDSDRRRERSETASKHKSRRQVADESADETTKEAEAVVDDEPEIIPAVTEEQNAATSTNVTPQPPSRRNPPNSRKRGRGGKISGIPQREGYDDPASPAKNGKSTDSPKENGRDGIGSEADSTKGANGTSTHNNTTTNERPVNGARRGRPGRDRHDGPRELTLTELKRRAAAMLEFISRSQKEMADAEMRTLRSPQIAAQPKQPAEVSIEPSSAADKTSPDIPVKSVVTNGAATGPPVVGAATMADDLATRLVKWQQEFTGEAAAATSDS